MCVCALSRANSSPRSADVTVASPSSASAVPHPERELKWARICLSVGVCVSACLPVSLPVCVCALSSLSLALALPTSLALVSCVLRNCQRTIDTSVCYRTIDYYRLESNWNLLHGNNRYLRCMFGSNMSAVATPSPPSLILYCSLQTGILIGISIWAPKSRRGHSTWPRDRETHTRTQTNTHYTHSAHTNIAKAAFCSCFLFFILAAPKTALSTILALPLTTPPSSATITLPSQHTPV